ncbi:MAG TPA: type II toxin-antitoxin system HipA family toxin, partial [Gammaproteobacteria bacterium]|nr:type II toxin-antitoxin system HipA family toxin [Gammaproteobacteria bacterium]
MKEIIIYIYLNNQFVPAGRLVFDQQSRNAHALFRYGERYLQRDDAISIDPMQLPLLPKQFS